MVEQQLYLVHHGIKGQTWGERRAEWYPIEKYKEHLKNQGFSESEIKKKFKMAEKGEKEYQKIDSNRKKFQERANKNIDKRYDKKLDKLNRKNATDGEKIANEVLRSMEHVKVDDISIDDYSDFVKLLKQNQIWQMALGPAGQLINMSRKDSRETIDKMNYRINNKDAKKIINDENAKIESKSKENKKIDFDIYEDDDSNYKSIDHKRNYTKDLSNTIKQNKNQLLSEFADKIIDDARTYNIEYPNLSKNEIIKELKLYGISPMGSDGSVELHFEHPMYGDHSLDIDAYVDTKTGKIKTSKYFSMNG